MPGATLTTEEARPRNDRRRPRGLDRNERPLAQAIHLRERAYRAAAWPMLLVGLLALFIAPILLASLVVSLEHWLSVPRPLGWWSCLALASLALIPLLFWVELRSRTQWVRSEVTGESVTIADALLAPARAEAGSVALGAVAEILLPAPRMILAARERLRAPASAATLHDAAAALNFLRQHDDDGVRVADLPTVRPLGVLCYLVSREWAGVSPAGDRVWLAPDAKRALDAAAR
ncbi:MAG TPA: hypothetical protein VER17_12845 [Tepidisphaeraceae bacterium]|nr:hypothetical protein [Tepidisphaeraceae bacterium]